VGGNTEDSAVASIASSGNPIGFIINAAPDGTYVYSSYLTPNVEDVYEFTKVPLIDELLALIQ